MQELPFRLTGRSDALEPATRRSRISRIAIALAILAAFIVVASVGYCWIEPAYNLADSLYMTVITITTVGYGYVHPLSAWGRLWTVFVILGGVATAAVVLSLLVGVVVEGHILDILGRRQVQKAISALSGHVIVCGYGRMGKLLADELVAAGRKVVVIEAQPERAAAAERAGLPCLIGDAQEEETLTAAAIERARVLIANLANDADNVFLTLSAKQANPSLQIIARAQEAATESMLRKAGADRVVCPEIIGASRIADVVVRPAVVDFVEMAHRGIELEMEQLNISEGSRLTGRTLEELALPRRIGAQVVAIRRADAQTVYQPTPDLKLAAGDTLVLVGRKGSSAAVQKLQREEA
jgi:voltage-gated potassium channel